MTPYEAAEVINRITYKNNWTIRSDVRPDKYCFVDTLFIMKLIDPRSGKEVTLLNRLLLTGAEIAYADEKKIVHKILNYIDSLEMHETREWFRYRGELVEPQH